MQLSFHGADRDVTGSCHMVRCGDARILIDCGMFQGGRELAEDNAEDMGFDPREIDVVLLTHAHLDHCGRLPLLVKRGFKGKAITTSATRDLARLVLLDSAHIQESDARSNRRHRARRGKDIDGDPLYDVQDAIEAMDAFQQTVDYGEAVDVLPGVKATWFDAGHILGSASIQLELSEGGTRRTILFSGDIGNSGRPILRDPQPPAGNDVVVMETTYGDRLHRGVLASVEELYEAIEDTFRRGGNVIIPTFALERAQDILFYIREGVESGRLLRSTPVYLDSPMAISATRTFRKHPECYDEETMALFNAGTDPYSVPNLQFTRDTSASIAINEVRGGAVILAGSGMCTGGRVRHHLRHNLWRKESSVIFVGYAAQGTLARRIVDRSQHVKIFGEQIPVQAQVYTINGFSAHADRDELLAWHATTGKDGHTVERTVLVHGEEQAMSTFAGLLKDTKVDMPAREDVIDLS